MRQGLLTQECLSARRHVRKVVGHNVDLDHSVVRVKQCLHVNSSVLKLEAHVHEPYHLHCPFTWDLIASLPHATQLHLSLDVCVHI